MNEAGEKKETMIADGTVMKGSITSDCPVTVSGKVDGDLSAPSLNITQSGSVHGQVLVEKIFSEGEISGEIEATDVTLSGKVRDKTSIKAQSLEVKLNAEDPDKLNVTFGETTLDIGGESVAAPVPLEGDTEEEGDEEEEDQ